ncbi:hypothetical protein MarSH_359 [Marseillevirus Shanghai 1]|nr:hypothetical protein MarSH_359 [Marseillevirus Shanghai 1]
MPVKKFRWSPKVHSLGHGQKQTITERSFRKLPKKILVQVRTMWAQFRNAPFLYFERQILCVLFEQRAL